MRKLLALVLSALLVFALAGCTGTEATAYELYTQASEKLAAAESFAADTNMSLTMTVAGEEAALDMSGVIKQVIHSETDIDMEMDLSTAQGGVSMATKTFFTDGWYYMDLMGQKVKMPMDLEDIQQQASYNIEFPESAIKDTNVEKVDGGSKVTFTLDGSVLESFMGSQLSGLGVGEEGLEITYGDLSMETLISKDGELKTLGMNFTFTMTSGADTIDCDADVTMAVTQMGGVVIDFPADLDTYQEMPAA